jgi:hypothetical protein
LKDLGSSSFPGANVFIEQELGRQMLWLACFHHVLDLLMEAAIVEKLGPTSGPREKYFAKFETYFNTLEKEEKAKISAESTERIGLVSRG